MQRSVYGEVYTRPKHWAVRVSVTWKQKVMRFCSTVQKRIRLTPRHIMLGLLFQLQVQALHSLLERLISEESRLQKTKNSWHVKRRGLMLYITCFAPANKPRCRKLAKEVDYLLAYVILKP